MKLRKRMPLRLKILITVLVIVTGAVGAITFTMANLFHQDKRTYITDVVSMVSISTADQARTVLISYQDRLRGLTRLLERSDLPVKEREDLLQGFFRDLRVVVAARLMEGERLVAAADHLDGLSQRGWTPEAFEAAWREVAVPVERVRDGQAFVGTLQNAGREPLLVMAVAQSASARKSPLVLVAFLDGRDLERILQRSRLMELSLWTNEGLPLVRRAAPQDGGTASLSMARQIGLLRASKSSNMTLDYVSGRREWIGGLAEVSIGGLVAVAELPRSAEFLAVRELLNRLIAVAALLLVIATLLGVWGAERITRPLEQLSNAARQIGRGEFDTQVLVRTGDEIGTLANAFNEMAHELRAREERLAAAQQQLVQSEKLAAFGQLGAGIAHEVKNPLAGILACAQLSLRLTEENGPLRRNIELIEKETRRCKTILESLLRFARQEKALFESIDPNQAVVDAVEIVGHQLKMNGVEIESVLGTEVPRIMGNSNQLQQVLINLMMNAQQAMGEAGGTVRVQTRRADNDYLEIRVTDDGPGIPRENRERIFEPFFSTKPTGKGTGLGLSVSFGIVKDHGGEIAVESEVGAGATFVIRLPLRPGLDEGMKAA
ncbi:MAG: HAMP domain-containing protein [Candidatus Eisenbacteria bacterium]|uniref:histidine kinase n=1 Tax=Eiseniibacteriota bacterium TaxID=2212470 RepID=A0A849SJP8_UNCEI|nr:HAMP domain-containing protein [Candidatus Eisenbacteria bacterium]